MPPPFSTGSSNAEVKRELFENPTLAVNVNTATLKQAAAERAVELVPDGATVGLGSGSTAAYAIDALGTAKRDITGVPTSFQARERALDAGIDVQDLDQVERIDMAIDGADQVADNVLIKGGGGAHTREKVIDTLAERLVIVVDPRKLAAQIDAAIPVAVIPSARTVVADWIRELGGTPELRRAQAKSGPVVTDNGNLILDCAFGTIDAPEATANQLATIPGVVEHGLFVGIVDTLCIGRPDGVETRSLRDAET